MKKIIIIYSLIMLLCVTLLLSSSRSLAYTKSDESNVTYTSSDTKDDSVSKTLKERKNSPKIIGVAIIGGVLVSSLVCGILVSKHKPVKVARAANSYLDNSRANITRSDDFFMRSSIDKQAK